MLEKWKTVAEELLAGRGEIHIGTDEHGNIFLEIDIPSPSEEKEGSYTRIVYNPLDQIGSQPHQPYTVYSYESKAEYDADVDHKWSAHMTEKGVENQIESMASDD